MSAAAALTLDGELTIYRAAELREQLLAAVSSHPAGFELDLAGVTEIDSAGVQLLLAAQRAARSDGSDMTLAAPSPAVTEVLELLGLAGQFGHAGAPLPVAA